jgi:hypothetical protein
MVIGPFFSGFAYFLALHPRLPFRFGAGAKPGHVFFVIVHKMRSLNLNLEPF